MRLFVGLSPDPPFRAALADMQGRLRAAGVSGRWLAPENLHLTLAFIGVWPEDVTALLPPVPRPFSLTLAPPGVFPEAKVLWAGVAPCPALEELAEAVRRSLAAAGVPFDGKPFYPHITLARKPLLPPELRLKDIIPPPAVMTVGQVCLFQSIHGPDGMEYPVIGRGAPCAAGQGEQRKAGSSPLP